MVSLVVLGQLYSGAQPVYTNTELSSAGVDLTGEGVVQYMFDILYVTWFTHLSSCLVSDYFWFVYLLVRIDG
jgi:hypothetical protein